MSKGSKIVRIMCKSVDEAANIQRAVDNKEVHSFLAIVGALLPLSKRGRTRVLNFVVDKLDEDQGQVSIETTDDRHGLEVTRG